MKKVIIILMSALVVLLAGCGKEFSPISNVQESDSELFQYSERNQDGLVYDVYTEHIDIIGYEGDNTNVVIPETILGLPVTKINQKAFSGLPITSITIPNSVTQIGDAAFRECENLSNIKIPDSVTTIGVSAFAKCGLEKIEFGNGLTAIPYDCFSNNKLKTIILPDTITTVDTNAFSGCKELESVVIGRNVKTFKGQVFMNCTNLKEVVATNIETDYDSAFEARDGVDIMFYGYSMSTTETYAAKNYMYFHFTDINLAWSRVSELAGMDYRENAGANTDERVLYELFKRAVI